MPEFGSVTATYEQGKPINLPSTTHLSIIGGVENRVLTTVNSERGKEISGSIELIPGKKSIEEFDPLNDFFQFSEQSDVRMHMIMDLNDNYADSIKFQWFSEHIDLLSHIDIERICDNFEWDDPTQYLRKMFQKCQVLHQKGKGEYLIKFMRKCTEIGFTEYQGEVFDFLIQNTNGISLLDYFEDNFTILDPKIYHPKILNTMIKEKRLDAIMERLSLFTGLDPTLHHTKILNLALGAVFFRRGSLKDIIYKLELLTGLDPEKYHQIIFNQAIIDKYYYSLADNLEKFTTLDPSISHKQLADPMISEAIQKGDILNWRILSDNAEKFTGLRSEIQRLLKRIKGRKNNIQILCRYGELRKSIAGFDAIFEFFLNHKQKSLIPLMQQLIIAKDIGVKTNFKAVTNLLDTSWIQDRSPREIKTQLTTTFAKLLELTAIPKGDKILKELENTLRQIQEFDDKAIETIQLKFINVVEAYFKNYYNRKVKQKFVNELGLQDVKHLDAILREHPEIVEGFKMEQSTTVNKIQFRDILVYAINHPASPLDLANLGENTIWLNSEHIKDKNMKLWQEKNEKKYDIGESTGKVDKTKDIEHFVTIANNKLELLGLKAQKDAGNLMHYYNTEVKKNRGTIIAKSKLSSGEFESLYNDLTLQVQSINDLFKETKAKTITSISIYRETDPIKVLMMGNAVDGSCLSFYSTAGNYGSTATNALDINKGVFFIENQDGHIIGRVLTAIDNEGKILRFRTYTKGNINIDLDIFFNMYIRELSQKIGLGLNGKINTVKLLNGECWYEDPIKIIPED